MGLRIDNKRGLPGWEEVKVPRKKLYIHVSEPGDWRRKKRSGAKKRRILTARYARKALRLLKRGGLDEEAGWMMLKFKRWSVEEAMRFAKGDWRIPKVVGMTREARGMRDWNRRFAK